MSESTGGRWGWGGAFTAGILLSAAELIQFSRGKVVEDYAQLQTGTEVFALPDPSHLVVFSLGYRSALADLLFGRTLVNAGIHFAEKRVFEQLDRYLDAIAVLDPLYRDVYWYADPLLTLSSVPMPKRNYRIARDFQERGRRLFPDDADLWMSSGQFVAYLAPQHLPPEEDPEEWRIEGARILEHACNVWPTRDDLPPTCLNASTLLSRAGEIAASIDSLRRLIALSDDPQVRVGASQRLQLLLSVQEADAMRESQGQQERLHSMDLPLASRIQYQMIGPPTSLTECAGRREPTAPAGCATSFQSWEESLARRN